jgi:hypothetical protein
MAEELVRKGAELGCEGEQMVVIFIVRPRYAEEWLPGDELKDEAAETPDVKSFTNVSGKNQFGGPKAEGSHVFWWWLREEVCCSWFGVSRSIHLQEAGKAKLVIGLGGTDHHPYRIT